MRRCLANLPSYYNDDDANELPVVLPVGRIVRGWNIIRAYGRPPSFSLAISLFLSFAHALLHPLEALHLPRPKLFTSSLFSLSLLFLFLLLLFFTNAFALFGPFTGNIVRGR